jgi:hypothetical protein
MGRPTRETAGDQPRAYGGASASPPSERASPRRAGRHQLTEHQDRATTRAAPRSPRPRSLPSPAAAAAPTSCCATPARMGEQPMDVRVSYRTCPTCATASASPTTRAASAASAPMPAVTMRPPHSSACLLGPLLRSVRHAGSPPDGQRSVTPWPRRAGRRGSPGGPGLTSRPGCPGHGGAGRRNATPSSGNIRHPSTEQHPRRTWPI